MINRVNDEKNISGVLLSDKRGLCIKSESTLYYILYLYYKKFTKILVCCYLRNYIK